MKNVRDICLNSFRTAKKYNTIVSVKMQSSIMGKFVFLNMNNGEFLLDRIMVCRLSSSPQPALCYAGSWSCEEQRSVM